MCLHRSVNHFNYTLPAGYEIIGKSFTAEKFHGSAEDILKNVFSAGLFTFEKADSGFAGIGIGGTVKLNQLLFCRSDLDGGLGRGRRLGACLGRCFGRGLGGGFAAALGSIEKRGLCHTGSLCNGLELGLSKVLYTALSGAYIRGGETGNLPCKLLLSKTSLCAGFLDEGTDFLCHLCFLLFIFYLY